MIRAADIKDAGRMAEIVVAAWKTSYAGFIPADYPAKLSAEKYTGIFTENIRTGRETMLVAEEGGVVWGFAGGVLLPGSPGSCQVAGLYVHPERHGGGYGAQLLKAMFALFRAKGCGRAEIWTLRGVKNNGFYRAMGGAEIGSRSYNFSGMDCPGIGFGFDIRTKE
jgi:GNAT superfamily N-acetyltransferase